MSAAAEPDPTAAPAPYRKPGETDRVRCWRCTTPNDPTAARCTSCGASFALPSRRTAVGLSVLAFLWGPGVGHVYLGRTWRGAAWFVASIAWTFLATAGARAIGTTVGYGAWLVVWFLVAVAIWAAAVVDVARLPLRPGRARMAARVGTVAFVGFLITRAVAVPVRMFFLEAFKIPSGAMIPTLLVGDHVFVQKWSGRAPERGEVVVFAFPENPEQDFVKRVLALPGDVLEVRHGHPVVNAWEVPHCKIGRFAYADPDEGGPSEKHEGDLFLEFLGAHAFLTFYDDAGAIMTEAQGPWTVAPGEFWVLGDNRNNSHDSRMWFGGQGGGVPFGNVRGTALMAWLSLSPGAGIDWSRTGKDVDRPELPKSAGPELVAALSSCLATRPPPDKATPPPPRPR